jgi:hypothetical protein
MHLKKLLDACDSGKVADEENKKNSQPWFLGSEAGDRDGSRKKFRRG